MATVLRTNDRASITLNACQSGQPVANDDTKEAHVRLKTIAKANCHVVTRRCLNNSKAISPSSSPVAVNNAAGRYTLCLSPTASVTSRLHR
jgi:hypothetical protein